MSSILISQVFSRKIDKELRETVRAIADEANDYGIMGSGIRYLAWKTDQCDRTIYRHLVKLRQKGALVKVKDSGFHQPTVYRLHLEAFPEKEPFTPKGDTLDTRDRHRGIFVPSAKGDIPELKGDTLTPEYIESKSSSFTVSLGTVPNSDPTVLISPAAKNAAGPMGSDGEAEVRWLLTDAANNHRTQAMTNECLAVPFPPAESSPPGEEDPFAGIGELPPAPAPPPKMEPKDRRALIRLVSLQEERGANPLKNKDYFNGFRLDWLDEVGDRIRQLFGYQSVTSDCYSVANGLLRKSRPRIGDKPASYISMIEALDRLAESREARRWKNNARVNPYMVPRWIENELARVPETGENGNFLVFTQ